MRWATMTTGFFFEQLIGQGMPEEEAAIEAQKMATDRVFEAAY